MCGDNQEYGKEVETIKIIPIYVGLLSSMFENLCETLTATPFVVNRCIQAKMLMLGREIYQTARKAPLQKSLVSQWMTTELQRLLSAP